MGRGVTKTAITFGFSRRSDSEAIDVSFSKSIVVFETLLGILYQASYPDNVVLWHVLKHIDIIRSLSMVRSSTWDVLEQSYTR